MDDLLPRPTPDDQLELLQRITQPSGVEDHGAPEEISKEFSIS